MVRDMYVFFWILNVNKCYWIKSNFLKHDNENNI